MHQTNVRSSCRVSDNMCAAGQEVHPCIHMQQLWVLFGHVSCCRLHASMPARLIRLPAGLPDMAGQPLSAQFRHLIFSTCCADASAPAQWVQPITKQQLPDVRPPNWAYRSVTTAVSTSVKYNTVPPASCLFLCNAQYITASVSRGIRNMSGAKRPCHSLHHAMIAWLKNGL